MESEENPDSSKPESPIKSQKDSLKKSKKKASKKRGKEVDREIVQLPPCRHTWCLGEVLKEVGIEPGVCWPRPLPWALTGRLPYLPGWERQCRNFKLGKIHYNVKPKRKNLDKEKFAREVNEAKLLWSYIAPGLLYPRHPAYEDPEPGVACDCDRGLCKRAEKEEA